MHTQYETIKREVQSKILRAGESVVVEQKLWHGSSASAIFKIVKNGFDKGFSGRTGELSLHRKYNYQHNLCAIIANLFRTTTALSLANIFEDHELVSNNEYYIFTNKRRSSWP